MGDRSAGTKQGGKERGKRMKRIRRSSIKCLLSLRGAYLIDLALGPPGADPSNFAQAFAAPYFGAFGHSHIAALMSASLQNGMHSVARRDFQICARWPRARETKDGPHMDDTSPVINVQWKIIETYIFEFLFFDC